MHYYSFHIGDYKSHTHHLNIIEDLAYRRLLDHYYLHEAPIKQRDIARQIGMRDHEAEVLSVLEEFFLSTDVGYINPRADAEIAGYHELKAAGKRGAQKRWHKDGNDQPIATPSPPQSGANATPIATSNHKPVTSNRDTTRGTRLPSDATLSLEYQDFCQKTRPDLNPDQLFEGFRDYWIAQPGQKGVKLDWFATWRTWVRNQKVTQTTTVSKQPNFKVGI